MGAAGPDQPVRHGQQCVGHGAEGARLRHRLPIRAGNHQAGHHRLLVDVQPATSLIDHVHVRLLLTRLLARGGRAEPPLRPSVLCVLPRGERQSVVPSGGRTNVIGGLAAPIPTRSHTLAPRGRSLAARPALFIRPWCRTAA